MNRVELVGTLTREPDVKHLESGFTIWNGTIAVNGSRFDGEAGEHVVTTVFVRLQAFGWMAQRMESWTFTTGEEMYVLGEFDQREVETSDGKKESKTRVTVTYVVPIRRKATPF